MADYAFPELHPDTALKKSNRNLLIYTRTRYHAPFSYKLMIHFNETPHTALIPRVEDKVSLFRFSLQGDQTLV